MSAHRRYKSLVESKSNILSGAEKKALLDSFEHWKTSKGYQFWLDRRTHVSTIITAGSIAESTPPYVEKSLKRNLSRMNEEAAVQTGGRTTPDARTDNERALELLPLKSDKKISEITFTVNYIAPILNATLKADDRPNTESRLQKDQGIKPDRPDILVKVSDHEILYGEITGPAQVNHIAKNNWDLFRLARFGKAFLDKGHVTIPLLQVVYDCVSVMRLSMKERGVYLLDEEDVKKLADSDLDYNRKRSWGYDDIQYAKKKILKNSQALEALVRDEVNKLRFKGQRLVAFANDVYLIPSHSTSQKKAIQLQDLNTPYLLVRAWRTEYVRVERMARMNHLDSIPTAVLDVFSYILTSHAQHRSLLKHLLVELQKLPLAEILARNAQPDGPIPNIPQSTTRTQLRELDIVSQELPTNPLHLVDRPITLRITNITLSSTGVSSITFASRAELKEALHLPNKFRLDGIRSHLAPPLRQPSQDLPDYGHQFSDDEDMQCTPAQDKDENRGDEEEEEKLVRKRIRPRRRMLQPHNDENIDPFDLRAPKPSAVQLQTATSKSENGIQKHPAFRRVLRSRNI
ncbi:hypothetical protein FBU30_008932 [Linnemannia zychae]|nr:hypothetical protein FBU30_008932 [Linnemannia zychae]